MVFLLCYIVSALFLLQVVAPNVSDMAGAEEVSLGSDELSESLTATEFTTEQDQGSQKLLLVQSIVVFVKGSHHFIMATAPGPSCTNPVLNDQQ